MKKIIRSMICVLVLLAVVLCALVACNNETQGNDNTGKYYKYNNSEKDPNSWIELKPGDKWTDGDDSGTYKIKDGRISLMVDGEELMSGTIGNGVLVLDFWGTETTYKKDGASGSQGGTQGSQTVDNEAKIISIAGGRVDGLVASFEVGPTTSAVDLSGMLTVSKNSSWQLYEDITGQVLIPTKYAANLVDGNNTYYIVVNSSDNKINRTYTLNIWKNFYTRVYYYADGELFDAQENVLSHTYLDDFRAPSVDGYTFLGWDCDGYYVESHNVRFDAKLKANTYTIQLDSKGGSCGESSKTVTYDSEYSLPKPNREGYTFNGWKIDGKMITTPSGNSIVDWSIAHDITATAVWTVNQYNITVQADSSNGGMVANSGTNSYDYGTTQTVTAETKNGYVFIGWYQGENKVCDSLKFIYKVPAYNAVYTAKWIKCPIKLNKNISSAGAVYGTDGKYVLGQDATVTAVTYLGYSWLGWYDGNGTKKSNEKSFSVEIGTGEIHLEARWEPLPEMGTFKFVSSTSSCTITGIKDKSLQVIVIPDCCTEVGDSAFSDCTKLTSISIPNSVIRIGDSAFKGCSALTDLTIGNCVREIDRFAFSGCSNLKSVVIPDSVIDIGDSAFIGCSSLKSLVIGNGVKRIGYCAFANISLKSVVIGHSVEFIDGYALNAIDLSNVYYCGTVEEWNKISIGAPCFDALLHGTYFYYFSEEEPPINKDGTAYDGRYWHYVDGVVTVWHKEN